MCGIAGFCINKEEHIDARNLAKHLLKGIEARGKDATGAAWYNGKTQFVNYIKAPKRAQDFCRNELFRLPSGVRNVILHTRWATQGSPKNENNNHPIVIGNLVGVHNGHISNDKEVLDFARDNFGHKRIGEVDSEAAFAIAKYSDNPLNDFADTLNGRAALAWIDGDKPRELNVTRVTNSPVAVAQTPKGSFVFASTKSILEKAMKDAGLGMEWVAELEEYEYMKIRNGAVIEYTDYKPEWVKQMEALKKVETNYGNDSLDSIDAEYGAWLKSVM